MEQHPVPQNVTTFQFRLIGDMTIKQFGYLAGGAIGAYVFYKLPLPFFFTWPLAISSALLGVGLAFVPIEERPMDIWILSFFKNVYSPTQFVWQKQAAAKAASVSKSPSIQVSENPGIQVSMQNPDTRTRGHADTRPSSFWSAIDNLFPAKTPGAPKPASIQKQSPTPTPTAPPVTFDMPPKVMVPQPTPTPASVFPNTPVPEVSGKHVEEAEVSKASEVSKESGVSRAAEEVEKKERALETQVAGLQKELAGKDAADSRVLELQKQLTALIAEHDRMEKELVSLRQASMNPSVQVSMNPVAQVTAQSSNADTRTPGHSDTPQPTISVMSADVALKAGLPRLTTYPNVVTGILKDNTKNLLPGVLVTVRDIEGIPLRALKTNRLGQFAASTPLPNGTYLVEVEDPRRRYVFDRVQITLNGTIVPVLEIIAKSERDLSRAQMAKDLFGSVN